MNQRLSSMVTTLLRYAIILLGEAPLTIRRNLAKIVGALIVLFPSRDREVCTLQLKKLLRTERSRTLAVYQHLVTVLFESFNLRPLLSSPTAIDSQQLLETWQRRDPTKGIIALSAHLGNWELLAAVAVREQVPLHVVGREARKSAWQDALTQIREQYGVSVLWRADSSAVKKMLSMLKAGEVIAALIDQDTEVRSIYSDFFGRPAKTPCALIELGLRAKAQFVTAFTIRLSSGQYKMIVEPLEVNQHSTLESIIHDYHTRLEQLIRKYPDQWVWVHKRWKTGVDGERLSSVNYLRMLGELP